MDTPPDPTSKPDAVIDLGNFTDTDEQRANVYFHDYLTCQPKWLSVRIEWNPNLNPGGDCHGWVDQVEFRARCTGEGNQVIPEPMSMVLGSLGLVAVAGLRRLRKR